MSGWQYIEEGRDTLRTGLREALFTLGNGYMATRGAAPEAAADGEHYPGTYVAGIYNRLASDIAGRRVEDESIVNLPNWLPLRFALAGERFDPARVHVLAWREELDLHDGLYHRLVRFRDREGHTTTLRETRLVSMAQPHLAVSRIVLEAEGWSGEVRIESAIDADISNAGVPRYAALRSRHLELLEAGGRGEHGLYVACRTLQSRTRIAVATRTSIDPPAAPRAAPSGDEAGSGRIALDFSAAIAPGRPLTIDKAAAIYSGRDRAISDPDSAAAAALDDAGDFETLAYRHRQRWRQLWQRFDFDIDMVDAPAAARTSAILRLHVFHLLQTSSLHTTDLDVGVPARGLHGEAYRGHVFWDELFVFPLLNLRTPEITRSLLQYRFRRLERARRNARDAGFRGAMYPWQSASDGREESQRWHLNPASGHWIADNSHLQRHVNAAIAYNVWQHFEVTGDLEFMAFYGAEMMLEIARFWADLASWNEALERFEIHGVMGPDEYHDACPGAGEPGLSNNAYTNVMAVWVLSRALQLVDVLPSQRWQELRETLAITDEELEHWHAVSRRMRIVFQEGGIISQFEGYAALEEFDWQGYRARYGNIQRLDRILEAEGDSPNRYKVSKQADVLMLFYLFSAEELAELFEQLAYPFDAQTIPANADYYLERTAHGSTLSRIVHSWVLARGRRPESWRFFLEALESDVNDVQSGTTREGIHIGAMAGTVDLVQRCFTGIETRGGELWLNPCLPSGLSRLRLSIRYRGRVLQLDVTGSRLRVAARPGRGGPVRIRLREACHVIEPGSTHEFPLQDFPAGPAPAC